MVKHTQFMRVTKTGVVLMDEFKDNPTLAHIVEVLNHKRDQEPEILEAIRDSFSRSTTPCPFCVEAHSLGLAVCLFCLRVVNEGGKET